MRRFYTAAEQRERADFWHRTAMPAPTPSDLHLRHRPYGDGSGIVEALRPGAEHWKGGDGLVGYLTHEPNGEISFVEVHPDERRQGIADAMYDYADERVQNLHHSRERSGLGDLWVAHEQQRDRNGSGEGLPEDVVRSMFAARTAMPAIDAYDDDPQFDDDYNPIPGTEQFPEEHRYYEQEIQPGPYYHATDQVFKPGDIVKSHRLLHGPSDGKGNHADWVWMGREPNVALSHAGPHLYEVEPMDEGPFEWNLDIFSQPSRGGRFVSPRARVVRVVPHDYPFWKDHKHASRTAGTPADLEWRHNLDGTGPEWELIATPPTGRTQVVQTENSGHQHYGRLGADENQKERKQRIRQERADEDWQRRSLTPAQQREQYVESIEDEPGWKYEWESRPKEGDEDYDSVPEQLDQDTLPGMEDILGESTRLWRGQPIGTSDPAFRRVWQMTYGQGEPVDDPGMFPDANLRYQDRGGDFDHPGLADAILDGFEAKGGVGEHHSTSFDVSDEYGRGNAAGSDVGGWWAGPHSPGPYLPTLLDSDWNGADENFTRGGSGNYPQEREIMLRHTESPLTVRDVRVPFTADEAEEFSNWGDADGWNSILSDSRNITAAGSFTCPPGQPGCVSAMGTPDPDNTKMGPKGERPTAKDYAEPWDSDPTAPDYTDYSGLSGVGGGTGGGGSWGGGSGGGGGAPDADNIVPSSRALYDQLMSEHPGADIGGYRVDGYDEHARGALDFMTSDPAQAAEVRQKAFDAGAPYVLWQQQQWNADGSTSPMENRGDPTQNHYDHVHIAPIGG